MAYINIISYIIREEREVSCLTKSHSDPALGRISCSNSVHLTYFRQNNWKKDFLILQHLDSKVVFQDLCHRYGMPDKNLLFCRFSNKLSKIVFRSRDDLAFTVVALVIYRNQFSHLCLSSADTSFSPAPQKQEEGYSYYTNCPKLAQVDVVLRPHQAPYRLSVGPTVLFQALVYHSVSQLLILKALLLKPRL